MAHTIKSNLSEHIIKIDVYGCGGTGSHVLNGLARMAKALNDLGHPGIHITAYDPDVVSYDNVGRQAFYDADVGQNKSKVLIQRINLYYRQTWRAITKEAPSSSKADIAIACVDTISSRSKIAKAKYKSGAYIIDCGNAKASGQVILGQYQGELPFPYEENRDLVEGEEPDEPNCVDQYYRQDLFINSMIAGHALHFVWSLFRRTSLDVRGVFTNLERGITNPIKC